MSFFNLWVAARELSLGEGAEAEEEEDEDAKRCGEADAEEDGVARLEVDEAVDWRALEALPLFPPLGARACLRTKFLGFGPRFFGPCSSLSLSFCSKPKISLSSKMFSSGSQVLCFIAHPFHFTKYSSLPLRTRRFSMASAAKTRSPSAESSIF